LKYQYQERALKAVVVAVKGDIDEVAIQLDLDLEADLF
jgi:hypothetical protein